jgi:hypothetical protein
MQVNEQGQTAGQVLINAVTREVGTGTAEEPAKCPRAHRKLKGATETGRCEHPRLGELDKQSHTRSSESKAVGFGW